MGEFEEGERLLRLALRLVQPGERQRACQLADGIGVGGLEVPLGGGVALRLELNEAHERLSGAVGGLRLHKLARQLLGTRPVALDQLHQEGLLDQHVVAGIEPESLPVVAGGRLGIVLAARDATGEVAAEQGPRIAARCGCIADAGSRRYPVSRRTPGEECRTYEEHRIASAHVTS